MRRRALDLACLDSLLLALRQQQRRPQPQRPRHQRIFAWLSFLIIIITAWNSLYYYDNNNNNNDNNKKVKDKSRQYPQYPHHPNTTTSSLFLQPALDCLGLSSPNNSNNSINISSSLQYPSDPYDHFQEINTVLQRWIGRHNVPYHKAPGYQGPWMENYWQDYVLQQANSANNNHNNHHLENDNFHTVFGPYIPLIPAWTDIYVQGGYKDDNDENGGQALVDALRHVLRPNVVYITVCQNDDGFPGNNAQMMQQIQQRYAIVVLSSGGYGHVAIPLLKQREDELHQQQSTTWWWPWRRHGHSQKVPVSQRPYLVSYVGSLQHAPHNMRMEMINAVEATAAAATAAADQQHNSSFSYSYYYGKRRWRDVMRQSKFSLCPRGFGRTSYHVMETLQMGLIPIQVYVKGDISWMPYPTLLLDNLAFTTTVQELPALLERLSSLSDAQIEAMETEIERLIPDYFTYEGVLQQIQRFLVSSSSKSSSSSDGTGIDSSSSSTTALQCRPLPRHVGSNRPKYFPPPP
jgi:hypothetical protein